MIRYYDGRRRVLRVAYFAHPPVAQVFIDVLVEQSNRVRAVAARYRQGHSPNLVGPIIIFRGAATGVEASVRRWTVPGECVGSA